MAIDIRIIKLENYDWQGSRMARKIYIIGNGFDLYFGLKTRVSDYIECLDKVLKDGVELYKGIGVYWNEFEEDLSNIDLELIRDDRVNFPDYSSDRESDRDGVIWEVEDFLDNLFMARDRALSIMVCQANNRLLCISNNLDPVEYNDDLFSEDDVLINFNYTDTVELLFLHTMDVFHIHGRYSLNESLIFGYREKGYDYYRFKDQTNRGISEEILRAKQSIYDDDSLSLDEKNNQYLMLEHVAQYKYEDPYVDKQLDSILEFYEMNQKPFRYNELESYLKSLNIEEYDEVVVLGHSMGKVDKEYMEIVEKCIKPNRWTISVFVSGKSSNSINNSFKERLKTLKEVDYTFFNKIILKEMTDLLNPKIESESIDL